METLRLMKDCTFGKLVNLQITNNSFLTRMGPEIQGLSSPMNWSGKTIPSRLVSRQGLLGGLAGIYQPFLPRATSFLPGKRTIQSNLWISLVIVIRDTGPFWNGDSMKAVTLTCIKPITGTRDPKKVLR